MWFSPDAAPVLESLYLNGSEGTEFLDHGGYFDLTPLDVATDYRKQTVGYLEAMGIPVEYVHHEVAPSQHEIDLRYSDALTMADDVDAAARRGQRGARGLRV